LLEELEDKGHKMPGACNGAIAMQCVSEEISGMTFADVFMPVMAGFDLILRLKGNLKTTGIPVATVTVMNARTIESKARELGVDHYLTKPWEPGELDPMLDQVANSAPPNGKDSRSKNVS
tara:strand:+ start:444 stop:803 length:360 start_codon:yes stop_codon:yes gene_type:complete